MRIAVLIRNFATTGGGAERYSIAVVGQLASRHDIHVFAQNIEHTIPGVTYHKVATPLARPRWINQLYFAAATWWKTRHGYDIVHSHENTWHGNVQTVHVLPIKHTLFTSKRGLSLALRWLKVVTSPRLLVYLGLERARYAIHGERRVVLTSNALLGIMQASYPKAVNAMEVIAPGVTFVPGIASDQVRGAARRSLGLPLDGLLLLFVANDFQKKGLPSLMQAMVKLPITYHLAVVGRSAQLPNIQKTVILLGLNNRVHFLGSMTRVDDAYSAANCLIHPTLEDTYAMVVLEAMAHGLPVLVSNAPYCGISADLTNGQNAMLLDNPKDVDSIVSGVVALTATEEPAKSIALAATQFARKHSWESVGDDYERCFQSITAALA
ncbi:MAG: glycosyltransferase family 4 protein [Undibacterium sp.]|uniref:glycosyltransferase family 4 protein n=1 Tax=Undibacterium sp. TaxID=1914977 RepID=UPI002715D782|nr:glycosyltransferase family 4 protein [Undibacterium sp.]MDO8651968.1 glycosyltransferase family 4 protein [Undibacterium sp.]